MGARLIHGKPRRQQFTPREARANKKLRPQFATAEAIKTVFETLVEYGLLTRIDDETYERFSEGETKSTPLK